jgi:hypothetical protein
MSAERRCDRLRETAHNCLARLGVTLFAGSAIGSTRMRHQIHIDNGREQQKEEPRKELNLFRRDRVSTDGSGDTGVEGIKLKGK